MARSAKSAASASTYESGTVRVERSASRSRAKILVRSARINLRAPSTLAAPASGLGSIVVPRIL